VRKISYSTILASLIFLGFFTNCSFNKNVGTSSLVNKTISFYLEEVGGPFDNDIYHKNLVFRFDSGGNYKTTLDGQLFQAGNYSYSYSESKGRLLITYSTEGSLFEYELNLIFETNTSGTWTGIYSNNPGINKAEGGTFEFEN